MAARRWWWLEMEQRPHWVAGNVSFRRAHGNVVRTRFEIRIIETKPQTHQDDSLYLYYSRRIFLLSGE